MKYKYEVHATQTAFKEGTITVVARNEEEADVIANSPKIGIGTMPLGIKKLIQSRPSEPLKMTTTKSNQRRKDIIRLVHG
jgi:hypothetical protein